MSRSLSPKLFEKLRQRKADGEPPRRVEGGTNINISIDLGATRELLEGPKKKKKKSSDDDEDNDNTPKQRMAPVVRPG